MFQNNSCPYCKEDHSNSTCPENKPLNELSKKYFVTKTNCKELYKKVQEIKSVEQAMENQIHNHLKKLKEDVDSKKQFITDYLNMLIDKQHNCLMNHINQIENLYLSQLNQTNKLRNPCLEQVVENLFSKNVKIYEN